VKSVTKQASVLNPQIRQIGADREKDKRTAQNLKRRCLPRAFDSPEKQAVGTTASATALSPRLDYRRLAPSIFANLFHLRIVRPHLLGLRRSFARAKYGIYLTRRDFLLYFVTQHNSNYAEIPMT